MRPISRYVDREAFALGFYRHLRFGTFEAQAGFFVTLPVGGVVLYDL